MPMKTGVPSFYSPCLRFYLQSESQGQAEMGDIVNNHYLRDLFTFDAMYDTWGTYRIQ